METTLKNLDLIESYFTDLTGHQIDQFKALGPLFLDWNQKINLISRKDTENFYLHHVLHALSIAKVFRFNPGSSILDLGTGGRFPGCSPSNLLPRCPISFGGWQSQENYGSPRPHYQA